MPQPAEFAFLTTGNQRSRKYCTFSGRHIKPPDSRTQTYHRVTALPVVKKLDCHIHPSVTHIPEHLAHSGFLLCHIVSVVRTFTGIEGITVHCPGITEICNPDKFVQTFLKIALFPFGSKIDIIHRQSVEHRTAYKVAFNITAYQVVFHIFVPKRRIGFCIVDKHVNGHCSIVFLRLPLKPQIAVTGRRIFRTSEGFIEFMESRILPVMTFILPAYKIDNLRDATA